MLSHGHHVTQSEEKHSDLKPHYGITQRKGCNMTRSNVKKNINVVLKLCFSIHLIALHDMNLKPQFCNSNLLSQPHDLIDLSVEGPLNQFLKTSKQMHNLKNSEF